MATAKAASSFTSPAVAPKPHIDPRSGYCAATSTFHSLRPPIPLPPTSEPLSVTSYVLSLVPKPLPSHPAFIDASSGESLSYSGLISQFCSLAGSLRSELGISKGHVVFVLASTCLEMPMLYLALFSLGAVVTPSNPACTPAELAHQIRLAKPRFFFATSSTASKLPQDAGPIILIDSRRFKSFLADMDPHMPVEEARPSDQAAILFSSGTTGLPKAAALSHQRFIALIAGFRVLQPKSRSSTPETTLVVPPMFHSMGFWFSLKGVAMGESTVVLGRLGMGGILAAAERYRVTEMAVSPSVVVAMAHSEETSSRDLSELRRVICGGAPLAPDAAKRFMARLPRVQLGQLYGSTEGSTATRMIYPEECRRVRSVGRLSPNMQAKIVDPSTAQALSVGQPGELWLKGPTLMMGYIGNAGANASTFSADGWLKTGDLCYFDEDGFLYIVDRLKELIKYNAYQVPPAELENILRSMPGIVDAAVVPYPHEKAGEIPMAFVVRKPGSSLCEAQVMDFVAKQVAPYKKIRRVAFIDSIPKSSAGKILRRKLALHALNSRISPL